MSLLEHLLNLTDPDNELDSILTEDLTISFGESLLFSYMCVHGLDH